MDPRIGLGDMQIRASALAELEGSRVTLGWTVRKQRSREVFNELWIAPLRICISVNRRD